MFSTPVMPRFSSGSRGHVSCASKQESFPLVDGVALAGIRIVYEPNEEVYANGELAHMAYVVVSGAVRCFTIRCDGRRQIGSFHFPGEFINLGEYMMYQSSAEAVCETSVIGICRSSLDEVIETDVRASHRVLQLVQRELQNARQHAMLLGRKHAAERLAEFLLDMARLQKSSLVVTLPMCRSDMADYLGLTIETVSRTLTQFERIGIIAMPSSRVLRLLDIGTLRSLAV
jgi:CRP/FNR family nitrogen fixation transcriptional regulator